MIYQPQGTGWLPHYPDPRNASWNNIFGAVAEAPPPSFTRPVPYYIPAQGGKFCCVCCTAVADQQYGSGLEGHDVQLSFREVYGETPGGSGGRNYLDVAKRIKDVGAPEDSYCPNDVALSVNDFLNMTPFRNQPLYDNASIFKIKGYSFINTDLNSLKTACYRKPIWIAFPGNNPDWLKPVGETVIFTGKVDWYHSVLMWDWGADYIGILNWWNDKYRKISTNYPISAALSTEDLPDNWKPNMLKLIGDKTSGRQYVLGKDNKLHWSFNETILNSLHDAGVVDKLQVDWKDTLAGYEIAEIWACIK